MRRIHWGKLVRQLVEVCRKGDTDLVVSATECLGAIPHTHARTEFSTAIPPVHAPTNLMHVKVLEMLNTYLGDYDVGVAREAASCLRTILQTDAGSAALKTLATDTSILSSHALHSPCIFFIAVGCLQPTLPPFFSIVFNFIKVVPRNIWRHSQKSLTRRRKLLLQTITTMKSMSLLMNRCGLRRILQVQGFFLLRSLYTFFYLSIYFFGYLFCGNFECLPFFYEGKSFFYQFGGTIPEISDANCFILILILFFIIIFINLFS